MPPSADDYDDANANDDRRQQQRRNNHHHRASVPPKFDVRLNPPYQIDFANVAAGKTIAATKRRVRFRFGFSNRQALDEGQTGTDCRGEEHEIVIIISALSGKRQVYSDGHEVHFSFGSMTDSTFETSWTMKGGHMVKIKGHVALPLFETPGFRQFDLTIDGLSYFNMPKLFELGVVKPPGATGIGGGATLARALPPRSVSPSQDNHYDAYGFGHRRSTPDRRPNDDRRSQPKVSSSSVVSDDEPGATSAANATGGVVDILSDMSLSLSSSDLLSAPTEQPPLPMLVDGSSSSMSMASNDQFAPPVAPVDAPNNSNHFASVSQSILSHYGGTGPAPGGPAPYAMPGGGVLALANESHTHYSPPPQHQHQQPYYHPTHAHAHAPVTPSSHYGAAPSAPTTTTTTAPYYTPGTQPFYPTTTTPSSHSYYAPVSPEGSVRSVATMDESNSSQYDPSPIKLSMQPLALEDVDDADALEQMGAAAASGTKRQLTDVERAMASLVNLGDIKENKVTPEQRKAMQVQQAKQQAKKKSQPAPPTAPTWRMGTNATLGDLKSTPKEEKVATGPKKEIMRTHAFDPRAVHAGMMVVYGQAADAANGGGAIPAPQGFGASSMARPAGYAPHPYYHQVQQLPPQPSYVSPAQSGY